KAETEQGAEPACSAGPRSGPAAAASVVLGSWSSRTSGAPRGSGPGPGPGRAADAGGAHGRCARGHAGAAGGAVRTGGGAGARGAGDARRRRAGGAAERTRGRRGNDAVAACPTPGARRRRAAGGDGPAVRGGAAGAVRGRAAGRRDRDVGALVVVRLWIVVHELDQLQRAILAVDIGQRHLRAVGGFLHEARGLVVLVVLQNVHIQRRVVDVAQRVDALGVVPLLLYRLFRALREAVVAFHVECDAIVAIVVDVLPEHDRDRLAAHEIGHGGRARVLL